MKRISSDVILNNLITKFGFKNILKTSIYEHIGDCISLLGYGLEQEVVYKQVAINFYKIPYPCDSSNFYNAYYKGKRLSRKICKSVNEDSPFGWLETTIIQNIKQINSLDVKALLTDSENLDDREELLLDVINSLSVIEKHNALQIDSTNWINPLSNVIETNIESGNVYLEYGVVAVDERGVPYIYDSPRYIDAITYYCAAMLIQSGYVHPVISYEKAMVNMETFLQRARNYEKRFTSEQADSFKSSWTNPIYEAFD